jgi:hypothetical protein
MSHFEFMFLVQDAGDTLVETQDLSLDDLQQTTGDQPQLLITEILEPESAENPIIQAHTTSSAAEVNSLIFSDFLLNSFAHFCSLFRFHQPCLLLFRMYRQLLSRMM